MFSDRGADADGDVDMGDGSSAMLDVLNGINPASLCNPPIDPALAAQVLVRKELLEPLCFELDCDHNKRIVQPHFHTH